MDETDNGSSTQFSAQSVVALYNEVRLHSAIGYVTPADHLAGLTPEIHGERDRKLEQARSRRRTSSRETESKLAVAT